MSWQPRRTRDVAQHAGFSDDAAASVLDTWSDVCNRKRMELTKPLDQIHGPYVHSQRGQPPQPQQPSVPAFKTIKTAAETQGRLLKDTTAAGQPATKKGLLAGHFFALLHPLNSNAQLPRNRDTILF